MEHDKSINLCSSSVFFSKTPRLARRIEEGLWKMLEDGSFDKLFNRYYREAIAKSDLKTGKHFV